MADNVNVTPSGTTPVASDDIGGVQYQRVKVALGAADAHDMDLDSGQQTMANSVPVAIASNQSTVPVQAQGFENHDSAISGFPVLGACYAETPDDSAPGNQVAAEARVVRCAADRDGTQYTHPHPPRIWHVATEYTAQQTDTTFKAAPGVGLSLYITDIFVSCDGAVTVTLEEGTSTLKFRHYADGQGSGVSRSFRVPIKLAANTLLSVTTSAAVNVTVVVCGFTGP